MAGASLFLGVPRLWSPGAQPTDRYATRFRDPAAPRLSHVRLDGEWRVVKAALAA